MTKTILVVDDKPELRKLLKSYLAQEGFRVLEAGDGQEALYVARYEKPDLVLLDLMMPNMGGYEFMQIFSREADTPVVILTARIEESDKVLGLELGADDYITKPFSMRELTARLRAVLRRASKQALDTQVLRAADLTLDRSSRLLIQGERAIDLTPSEFDILSALMGAPGRAFTRAEMLSRIQDGMAYEGYERTIDVHIRNLRLKIEPDPTQPKYIETVYGLGYRFAVQKK